MKASFLVAAFLLLTGAAFPAVILVPDHHATIQGAINAAATGDMVVVRPGTYYETITFAGKAITVRSGKGPSKTVIDARQAAGVVRFEKGETKASVIEGFTISNGYSSNGKGGVVVDNSSPTIRGNIITGNTSAFHGGGINIEFGSPDIIDNIFTGNSSGGSGSGSGGAIGCSYGNPVIVGNIFRGNAAYGGDGGAIYTEKQSVPTLSGNFFTVNKADNGGAISFYDSTPFCVNNTIVNNKSAYSGGGIFNGDYTTSLVANTIVRNNASPTGPEIHQTPNGKLTVVHCDVLGGYAGTGNFDADPLFVAGETYGFHLTWTSPCRNTGDSALTAGVTRDIEGDARIFGKAVDVGADEFAPHLYHLDGSFSPGSPIEVRLTAPGGASPVMLGVSLNVQGQPQPTPYGDLRLVLPAAVRLPLGAVPADGVLVLNTAVPLKWPAGRSYYFQALVGPIGHPKARLTNLMVLALD